MVSDDFDRKLRTAAMQWLDDWARAGHELFTFDDLAGFVIGGQRVALMDRQRGIRKPAALDAALSFRTAFTPPGKVPPYADTQGPDGLLRYKYRGDDPEHPENVALRRAQQQQLPLIWFVGVAQGVYMPRYPVYLVADEPRQLQFAVALDEVLLGTVTGEDATPAQRAYADRVIRQRLHQPLFRARVVHAYGTTCAMCHLHHAELLDAAHILPDTHERGQPVVSNGICLCKIHHAAYDRDFIGIRPDLVVEVRADILKERDGPMLKFGLQAMNDVRLVRPRERDARPDAERLEERYERFRRAG